ncbi:hypothetical protein GOODEAATRI_027128 [Goodea atripinnis]|uniref:Uncharacterized protein n=1 Tax=Goodea atripinnis TaxID=208336 RepID=A0ABV0NEA6_9TELE
MVLSIMVSSFVSSVQKTLSQKSRPSSNFANISPAAILFLEKRGFLFQPFQTAILVQCFSDCPIMTFNLLTEASRVYHGMAKTVDSLRSLLISSHLGIVLTHL